ncbi:MAG: DUF4194 domain-containing protein [Spirochaetaceae bacterium]|nr:DUF4194 domain-containing protein [Spirochaetaceae bacterium]
MTANDSRLSLPLVSLLRGLVHREADEGLWQRILSSQADIRDYVALIGLELVLDEAEGFAWLRTAAQAEGEEALPRLMTRRQLPYLPSLLLALLRKKLAETDASGEGQRLVLNRDELVDLVRVFLGAGTNEARITEQVLAAVNRIEDLGFVRRLRAQEQSFEVRRVLKAFVDAQWLSDFDARLEAYRSGAATIAAGDSEAEE